MKVLLVDPPYERFIGFRSEWFPLGLCCIASYLNMLGHEVAVYHAEHGSETEYKSVLAYADQFHGYAAAIDAPDHPVWEEVEQQVLLFRPELVGISVITSKVPSAFRIARICKEIDSGIKVVFGGNHSTVRPEEMLFNTDVDFVIRGEGEQTMTALLEQIESPNPDYSLIDGLSYRKDSAVVNNSDRVSVNNLDDLPLPGRAALLNLETYSPVQLSMVMTSRGCPYRCGFCASRNLWGKTVRFRSIMHVIEEIKELRGRYGVNNITIMDDSFTIHRDHVEQFCSSLIERRLGVTWSCLTRVNMVSDQMITMMRKAGCTKVDIGIESGNQRVLDLIKKDITLEQVRMAVRTLKRCGMFWSGFFMFGFPTETEEEVYDTLNFLHELKPDSANISIFTPYPGTSLYDMCVENGLISNSLDYAQYSHQNVKKRFTDKIPIERFPSLATHVFSEVHRYNSSCRSLLARARTRRYHKNPKLLFHDARKLVTWLRK